MTNLNCFDEIRPFNEQEIPAAIKHILADKTFLRIVHWLFPDKPENIITENLQSVSTSDDFQSRVMYPAFKSILAKTSDKLTYNGFEKLDPEKSYLFISNHRDITLDSGLLQLILFENKFPTSEISAGSNLLFSPLFHNIGKINKMFTVIREGDVRTIYENLKILSGYIRHTINYKNTSVWIAQRNGRTKNGDDRTEIALLKMLHASYDGDFIPGFKELNIIPISISYEYEPCDGLKTKEVYKSIDSTYIKEPGEDLQSIITGIVQPKGRIHLQFGNPLNPELHDIDPSEKVANMFKILAVKIDHQIHSNYHLFQTNYIAYDMLSKDPIFIDRYSQEEKNQFQEYALTVINSLHGDHKLLEKIFLELYASPVENYLSHVK